MKELEINECICSLTDINNLKAVFSAMMVKVSVDHASSEMKSAVIKVTGGFAEPEELGSLIEIIELADSVVLKASNSKVSFRSECYFNQLEVNENTQSFAMALTVIGRTHSINKI